MPVFPVIVKDGICTLEVTTTDEIAFTSFMVWLSALEVLQKLSPINSIALDRDPTDPTLYQYLLKMKLTVPVLKKFKQKIRLDDNKNNYNTFQSITNEWLRTELEAHGTARDALFDLLRAYNISAIQYSRRD